MLQDFGSALCLVNLVLLVVFCWGVMYTCICRYIRFMYWTVRFFSSLCHLLTWSFQAHISMGLYTWYKLTHLSQVEKFVVVCSSRCYFLFSFLQEQCHQRKEIRKVMHQWVKGPTPRLTWPQWESSLPPRFPVAQGKSGSKQLLVMITRWRPQVLCQ